MKKYYKLDSFLILLLLFVQTISSCKTTSSHSGLSEVDSDALYSNAVEEGHLEIYAKKQTSSINGIDHVFYALPFVVELDSNGKAFFVNLSKTPADTISNHSYLLEQLDRYRGQSYFELITPGPQKKLSSGYLYFKKGQGEISDPIGFELVLLDNGQNLSDSLKIMERNEEISQVYEKLKQVIQTVSYTHLTLPTIYSV